MNLFIDSLSSPACLALFDDSRHIINTKHIDIARNESSKLVGEISIFLKEYNFEALDLENIVVTNGPGSFTGVRTVVLIVNTIAYRNKTKITPVSYFDLFNDFPIIKCSSKRDVFIKKSPKEEIQVLSNEECMKYLEDNNIEKFWGDFDKIEKNDILYQKEPDYATCISKTALQKETQIEALYIKKPNIS